MATIAGRVVFDRDRSAIINSVDTGIANIPVVLQNTVTNFRLTVLTDNNGNYSFINVPDGSYRLVESYGQADGVATPGNFVNAVFGSVPDGVNPPVSTVTNPPTGTTNLDSLTPDTLLITVSLADQLNLNFLNGPVIYTPIQTTLDDCAIITPENLITAADFGTFGSFLAGTPANTGAPVEPYPGVSPGFTYVLPNPAVFTPLDGEYTVQNLMTNSMSSTIGAWWRIADHTIGNETGRMMIVNGFNPGAIFFQQTVSVQPNTKYLFTAWIMNLFKVNGYPNPELGVVILDENGEVLYAQTLGTLIPVNTNAPEWKQIGSVINSQSNTSLTVEFLSEGPDVIGNDYAIDDIALNEILLPEFIPVKSVDIENASVGQTVEYTVTLENTCTSPLTDLTFQDTLPNGLTFVNGSVTVNGVGFPLDNPNSGFTLPDVPGGDSVIVKFKALVTTVPVPNPAINTANITYFYTPVDGGIPIEFNVITNEVPVLVGVSADVSVAKVANPSPVKAGSELTYTITVANAGPSTAENVIVTDAINNMLSNPEYSLDGGITFLPWTGSLALGTMASGISRTILIRALVSESATLPIPNTVSVTSTTPDPNPNNNTDSIITNILTPRCQAITDVIESVALQEAALAHILNAEGEKMQAFIAMDVDESDLLSLNSAVRNLVGSIARLEAILQGKLENVTNANCAE